MANVIIKMNDKPSEKDMERFRLAIENPDFGNPIKNNGFTYYNKSVDLEIAKQMYFWLKVLTERKSK